MLFRKWLFKFILPWFSLPKSLILSISWWAFSSSSQAYKLGGPGFHFSSMSEPYIYIVCFISLALKILYRLVKSSYIFSQGPCLTPHGDLPLVGPKLIFLPVLPMSVTISSRILLLKEMITTTTTINFLNKK